ncbi:hypothetical protein D3C79_509890 [compost metagenome]
MSRHLVSKQIGAESLDVAFYNFPSEGIEDIHHVLNVLVGGLRPAQYIVGLTLIPGVRPYGVAFVHGKGSGMTIPDHLNHLLVVALTHWSG